MRFLKKDWKCLYENKTLEKRFKKKETIKMNLDERKNLKKNF